MPRRRLSRWGLTVVLAGALVLLSAAAAVGYGLITPQERDLGMRDWTVEVEDEVWDANRPGEFDGKECASFQTEMRPRTVVVTSAIHEPESGWRQFVPWM